MSEHAPLIIYKESLGTLYPPPQPPEVVRLRNGVGASRDLYSQYCVALPEPPPLTHITYHTKEKVDARVKDVKELADTTAQEQEEG